jgi:hypothetical protein
MTFLAPLFLYLGIAAAAGAVALHFIVTRQPTSSPLPTVRFVPESSVRVTTIARPEHWWLLLARVLAALLVGAAFARPVLAPTPRPVGRVVLADVSRDVGDMAAVRDSARALLGPGDVLVAFDTAARVITSNAADSAAVLERSAAPARLSPALVAALRAAAELRDEADSLELTIVSPLRAHQMDGATLGIRALWPGGIRFVAVPSTADTLPPESGVRVSGATEDDALALAVAAAGIGATEASVRLVRDTGTADDSIWVAGGRRTLVRWPAGVAPLGWIARSPLDTVGAVVVGERAVVHPLERRWVPTSASMAGARVVARWVDGQAAALERGVGDGCIRDVAVPVPARGDLVLRPAFAHFVRAITAPCAAVAGGSALDEAAVEALAGDGGRTPSSAIAPPETVATPIVPWLVAAALVVVLLELLLRRRAAPTREAISVAEERGVPEAAA